MTAFRLIPLPVHSALRMATGLFTMLVPFLAGFAAPAMVMSVLVGALVTGVALCGVVEDDGLTALPVSTLHTLDYGLVLGLFGVAAVVAVDGDTAAGGILLAIATVQLFGNLLTKYSLRA